MEWHSVQLDNDGRGNSFNALIDYIFKLVNRHFMPVYAPMQHSMTVRTYRNQIFLVIDDILLSYLVQWNYMVNMDKAFPYFPIFFLKIKSTDSTLAAMVFDTALPCNGTALISVNKAKKHPNNVKMVNLYNENLDCPPRFFQHMVSRNSRNVTIDTLAKEWSRNANL